MHLCLYELPLAHVCMTLHLCQGHSLYMYPTQVVWTCSARGTGVDALRMEALEAPSAKRSKTAGDAGDQQQTTVGKK